MTYMISFRTMRLKFVFCVDMLHKIHIPVMGICYTVDSPIRVAPFGLTSVISLVDDGLLEEYRMAYSEREGIDVGPTEHERVGRIRAYLDFVADEINRRFEALQGLRFQGGLPPQFSTGSSKGFNDKDRYFLMLPADSPLRLEYEQVCLKQGMARIGAEVELTKKMEKGEIQANIMVNLNHKDAALDAVHGFATSKIQGSLVLSAGINLGVFEEIAKHPCFYRLKSESNPEGVAPLKKIILKVSDYRSAQIQGRYLAKKGLEVYEYRIESGVNCGGHAFCATKKLLPDVLNEFVAKKQELFETTQKVIAKFEKIVPPCKPSRITAQGGLCCAQEISQVLALGVDGVGVGTPFLLVPQATSCDKDTRKRLAVATLSDVRLTHASPLGIPFMNLVTSSAAEECRKKAKMPLNQDVGFDCIQHYLCREIPGFKHPVCMASREYVRYRLKEIDSQENVALMALGDNALATEIFAIHEKFNAYRSETLERECICRFLGNAGREELRNRNPSLKRDNREIAAARLGKMPNQELVTICPGSSIAYFSREYTLFEMMQHLYGIGPQITPVNKPHAFDLEKELLNAMVSEMHP